MAASGDRFARHGRRNRVPSTAVLLEPQHVAVLNAVLILSAAGERPTVRAIGGLVDRGVSAVHAALVFLRDVGLVSWEDGQKGSLHPTVQVISLLDRSMT